MSLLSESRALAPVLLRDHWRQGLKERPGRLLFGGVLLLLGLILAFVVAAIGELPDERLRRNLLNFLGLLGVVGWLAAAIGARIEMSRQFDVRRLRVLPVRFGTLYTLRVGAGLSGFWIVVVGPALLHLLAARTAGLVSVVVALLAILALVVLLGRLTALVLLGLDDAAASWLVTATLLTLALAALLAVEPVVRDRVLDLSDRSVVDGFADRIRESRALSAAGYLPGGLLAAIFEAPRDVGANLVRLAALWLAAGGCMLIEARTLRRSGPVPAAATGGSAAGCLLPLARILRRTRRLEPSTGLALIEFESWMRTA